MGQGEREGRRPPGTGGGSKRGSPPHPLVTRLPPAGAGPGEVEVFITDPSGRRGTVEPTLEARGDGTYRCTYRPTAEGPHAVHVAFGGAPIPKSPFNVTVGQGEPRGAPLSPPPPRGVSGPPTPQAGGLSPSLAWGSLSSCPPSTWGSLSFPAWGPLSLQLGGLCLPLNSGSLPPPPHPQLGGLCPLWTWGGSLSCPHARGSALSSPPSCEGGGGLCPSQLGGGGLCAFCPPTQGGCLCASAPPRALVGGSLPPTWGARGCRCRGVLAPRDSALSLSTCPAPSARLSGKRRPGSSRVTH